MKANIKRSKPGIILLIIGIAVTLGGLTVTYAARQRGNLPVAVTSAAPPPTATVTEQVAQPSPTAQSAGTSAEKVELASSSSGASAAVALPTATLTAQKSAKATATSQPVQAVATKVVIKNFPLLAQSYALSCEYAAASAVTLFWGSQVTEDTFVDSVPSSPNPHLGFRGDINGAFGGINNYGVYAEALVPVLEDAGYNATVFYGGVSRLKANLAAGNPVVVWITTGKYTVRTPVTRTYNGDTFKLVAGEHAVVIYGYDSGGVYIMDVSNGSYQYTAWDSFVTRWSYFDQMSLVITPK